MPDPYDRLEDRTLIALSRKEPEAFAAFYRRHVDNVLGYFMSRTHRADLSLDLAAETFAAALSSAHRYRPGSAPAEAWLYGIARNKLAHAVRRGSVDQRLRQRLRLEPLAVDDAGLEMVERRAAAGQSALMERLAALPTDQRAALEAHVLEERDYSEIAAELDCSTSVIRQRVSRALSKLRPHAEQGAPDA
ncbi:MAG: RNA polymerase sigma factor [Solirubrobacteraceae bacterium]